VDTEDIAKLDFNDLAALTFGPIDRKTFRCFDLAMQAARLGGTATCVLNAAGEVANLAFRQDRIPFLKIEQIIERTLSAHDVAPVESVEHLEAIDAWARTLASSLL
jgi:1-deoxy-D-xylulose-5-phosphate reductoisomerase